MDVYSLSNPELVQAYKNKNKELIMEISSKSIFLIPVKNKNNINKISFESMMDSNKKYYLPIFINMADIKANPMIKGKEILIAHFGMIETLLKNNNKIDGIVINPCTMDYKLTKQESFEICSLYHKNEDKLDFEPDFYKQETYTMADLKPKEPIPRAEVLVDVVEYLKKTTIKKAYIKVNPIGDKLQYKLYIDYNRNELSFINELEFILNKSLNENEIYEILNSKQGRNVKMVKFMKPIYEKKR